MTFSIQMVMQAHATNATAQLLLSDAGTTWPIASEAHATFASVAASALARSCFPHDESSEDKHRCCRRSAWLDCPGYHSSSLCFGLVRISWLWGAPGVKGVVGLPQEWAGSCLQMAGSLLLGEWWQRLHVPQLACTRWAANSPSILHARALET